MGRKTFSLDQVSQKPHPAWCLTPLQSVPAWCSALSFLFPLSPLSFCCPNAHSCCMWPVIRAFSIHVEMLFSWKLLPHPEVVGAGPATELCMHCSCPVSARAHKGGCSATQCLHQHRLKHWSMLQTTGLSLASQLWAEEGEYIWKPHIHKASSVSVQSWSCQENQQESWIKPAVLCSESYPQISSFFNQPTFAWTYSSST